MSEQIYLSRRNLLALLSKLDRKAAGDATACTVVKFRNLDDPFIQTMGCVSVTAVEDDAYYANRGAGPMHPADEETILNAAGKVILASLPLENRVYTRETNGAAAREMFRVDELDSRDASITIVAPGDTYAISNTFWRGLLEPSLAKLGDMASAYRKIKFEGPQQFQASFSAYVVRHFLARGAK